MSNCDLYDKILIRKVSVRKRLELFTGTKKEILKTPCQSSCIKSKLFVSLSLRSLKIQVTFARWHIFNNLEKSHDYDCKRDFKRFQRELR